ARAPLPARRRLPREGSRDLPRDLLARARRSCRCRRARAAGPRGPAGRGGARRGETVAIMGNACPEWTIADLATQAAGGISYGIYPTSSSAELAYLLRHGGARRLGCGGQGHLHRARAG